jgi:ADP-heptose:LPS heptosyltransferase
MEVARAVQAAGARLLRGGAFKPRTSPYSFQGLEERALIALARARDETGLPIVTEAMNAQQLELVVKYADMVQIGARGAPLDAAIEPTPQDRSRAAARLSGLGLAAREFILLFPGSGSPRKNWPIENFVTLAEHRVAGASALVVLGPAEAAMREVFAKRSIAMLDGVELGEVAGLAHFAKAFVVNDSGVAHLAAAAGARGLVLFGVTEPSRWGPLGEIRTIHRESIAKIAVGEVVSALADIATAKGSEHGVRVANS